MSTGNELQSWIELEGLLMFLNQRGVPWYAEDGNTRLSLTERVQKYAESFSSLSLGELLTAATPQPQSQPAPTIKLTKDQEVAFSKIEKFLTSKSKYFLLRGFAGTGKTFLLQLLRNLPYHVVYTSPTNKAAKVLGTAVGTPASTIYSFLGIRMQHTEDHLELVFPEVLPRGYGGSVLVVDESSMVGTQLLTFIKKAAKEMDLKVIFVGDPAQLRPIGEERSPVWQITKDTECRALLREVVRNNKQLFVLATAIRECIKTKEYSKFNVQNFVDGEQVRSVSQLTFEKFIAQAGAEARVVAWRNKAVDRYNDLVRTALGFTEEYCIGDVLLMKGVVEINEEIVANTDDEAVVESVGQGVVSVGDTDIQVWVLGCDFGDTALTLHIPTDRGQRRLDKLLTGLARVARNGKTAALQRQGWKEFWKVKNSFHSARYGFAFTAHRAQGSTYRKVFVDQRDIFANPTTEEAFQCFYVASTRPSEEVIFN